MTNHLAQGDSSVDIGAGNIKFEFNLFENKNERQLLKS